MAEKALPPPSPETTDVAAGASNEGLNTKKAGGGVFENAEEGKSDNGTSAPEWGYVAGRRGGGKGGARERWWCVCCGKRA